MKSFRKLSRKPLLALCAAALTIFAAGWMATASGALPAWIRNIEGRTDIEAAFFRLMALPGGEVAFRRPPSETRPALGDLLKKQPGDAELYSLRALEDEQQLDFTAAEGDWKSFVEKSADKSAALLSLADYYHRRLQPLDEIKALSTAAGTPPDAAEKLTPAAEQRSWRAFERIFGVIRAQGLPAEISMSQYRSWLARYPQEPSLYARFLEYLISVKDFSAATQLIAQYHEKFPADEILPVKARALVEYRQGSLQQGLAVYEKSFQPLWAPELIKSYFDLLTQTHSLRKFLDEAKAAQNANPEDLSAAARIFYYYQQQGKLEAAQETIAKFRLRKDASGSAWYAQDLYVCARLLEEIHAYPESARFYFALYNSKGMNDAQGRALGGLANLLLTAPETPIRFGAGELSMYRDIATMDQGPGYLNGILSLLLNTTSPASEFSGEEDRAVSYFHRSRAAELVALFDAKFPSSHRRAELHATLLEFYASAGESDAVIKGGKEFLTNFPNSAQRTAVALLMADAFSRTGKFHEEFAIYDSVLQELAVKADRIPLGSRDSQGENYSPVRNTSEAGEESETERAQDVKASRGEVVPIIAMDLETAVASAVAAESDSDAPPEALKAQAIVARSYFLAGGGRHRDFDFCDLTHCQFLREPPALESPAAVATRETRGLVLTFEEKPFAAMFSGSCGGHTRTPAAVGLPGSGYHYFSVLCDFCYKSPYRWTHRLSLQDAALLGTGEPGRLAVDRRLGWNAVPSNNFTSRREGGQVILQGAGQGHGIGLCQRGAKAMAEEGGSFRQILNHYFPNTALMQLGEPVARSTTNERLLPPYSLSLLWAGREFAYLSHW